MFCVKTHMEENRTSMTNHPRLLETLAGLCLHATDNNDDNDDICAFRSVSFAAICHPLDGI